MDINNTSKIPFLDLVAPHSELEAELVAVFQTALRNAAFIGGPAVERFERNFAEFCGTKFAVGVSNGTDALKFALLAAGIGPGDAVVTVPNTFAATVEAILQAGAQPEFVDIDPRTFNMDVPRLEEYLDEQCDIDETSGSLVSRRSGKRVAAIIPVHLYGQMADMDPILELAERYDMKVIEDACQAHGARYFSRRLDSWRTAGSMGTAAAFSFYPGKNLGACGEAGAVTTNDPEIARSVRMLRDHGQPRKYYHDIEGFNGRLDAIQAGILDVKLKHLADWNKLRQAAADTYRELFSSGPEGVILPFVPAWSEPVYHLFVIRTEERDALQAHLASAQIDTGIHYPIPLHLQAAFRSLGYRNGDFSVTEGAAAQILSLPMYPQLRSEQQERIVEAIAEFSASESESAGSRQLVGHI
ncbi:MAG TPA: DegT/DnrJ/EryC1/StrS family aminotransferase [Candidatus Eisenbacteria bacterium]|nr:DegT/DnrJ/EryC1/StrS family aminotransferase [Candidatus Eisenbacteria bacterium]